MSSRSPLLLVSGVGGVATGLVSTTTGALAKEGKRVALIDASDVTTVGNDVAKAIQSSIGRVFEELGGDPLSSSAWATLPGAAHINTLWSVLDALSDPHVDVVVVNCGPTLRARELIETPAAIVRLLDATMSPRLAMWRSADDVESAPTLFEALGDFRSRLLRMQAALSHRATVMRIASAVDDASLTEVGAATAAIALLGVNVDSVEAVSEASLCVTAVGDEFALDVRLPEGAISQARAGRQGNDLVIDFTGVRRWLQLPPVLRRCTAVDARRTAVGMSLRFVPDPAQWPRAGGSTT